MIAPSSLSKYRLAAVQISRRSLSVWLIGVILFVVSLLPSLESRSGADGLYAQQAAAFLHGRLDLPQYGFDSAVFRGRFFVPFPPFPSLLLLPGVAFLGTDAINTLWISLLLTVVNARTLRSLLGKIDAPPHAIPWLLAAFFGGTAYWYCLSASAGVWHFAHLVAVTCLLLALREALGTGRGPAAGLLLGLGFLSRQMLLGSCLFLAVALFQNRTHQTPRDRGKALIGFGLSFGACLTCYLAFNWARFGSPLDPGYRYLVLHGVLLERVQRYGLFHPAYLPFNAASLFLQGFQIDFTGPMRLKLGGVSPFGTSLTFASPFLFAAFRARWQPALLRAAWVSIILTLLPTLFYYNNGFQQFNGQRFSLDFLPILLLLVARGLPAVSPGWWKATVAYSVGLNALALGLLPVLASLFA